MNNITKKSGLAIRGAAALFALAMMAAGTWAQDTTRTVVRHGESSYETEVRNAQVVYVQGNDLVLKMEDGKVEHLVVPDSDKFTIDGNEVSVHELAPGTKLTQTIVTTTAPRYVSTVRTLKGKVWHVTPPGNVILRLPDNTHQSYKIPNDAKITLEGKSKTVFDLRKGMNIEATIVTDDTHTVIERNKLVVGQAPPPPATPRVMGMLVITRPAPELATFAAAEEPASTLPETGTTLPLMGLLGGLGIAASLGLGAVRKAIKA
jgi:hypothetical protein